MAGALVDFGLYFFHNIHVRMSRGSATYYYLPKMETFLECRLWNQVFQAAEDYMQVPQGGVSEQGFFCLGTGRLIIYVNALKCNIELGVQIYRYLRVGIQFRDLIKIGFSRIRTKF